MSHSEARAFWSKPPRGWKKTALGDICRAGGGKVQTGPFGSQLHAKDYVKDGIPSIMPINLARLVVDEADIKRVSKADARRLARHRLKPGDIIYSRRGDISRRALISRREEGWLCGTGCLKVDLGKGPIEPRFVFYFLGHPSIQEYVHSRAVGSTMPNLNTHIMESVPILLPSRAIQRGIAETLGNLDDKIELNRQMNRTLESLAQAIFKSWFVDFEPVGVGAYQGPFSRKPIYLCASVTYGAPFKSNLFNKSSQGQRLIRIRDLKSSTPEVWTTEEHPKEKRVSQGDILVGMDGEFRPYFWNGPEALLNQRVCLFAPKDSFSRFFVKLSLEEPLRFFERSKVGTTVIHLGKRDIDEIEIVVPPLAVRKHFASLTEPLLDKILVNNKESQTLAELRDTLLPKLMSGEIRLKEAEKQVGEAV